jgi:hypothetical protein
MLVLRRKEGQWLKITHKSGDVLWVRTCNIKPNFPGRLNLLLDDDAHNFAIERPERSRKEGTVETAPTAIGMEAIP